jgi:SAM-dependent methyltransferase
MVCDLRHKVKSALFRLTGRGSARFDSGEYWEQRYRNNGNSGAGSYLHLAGFKADFLNSFVRENDIRTVVEFGCGDGNQLKLAKYPRYIGFDVSPKSIEICSSLFRGDLGKSFHTLAEAIDVSADLALSLDVIYHLVEDDVYHRHMERLFHSSTRWVIVYASNTDVNDPAQSIHVRHRKFTSWIERERPDFELVQHVPNQYPVDRYGVEGSFADFFVFRKRA